MTNTFTKPKLTNKEQKNMSCSMDLVNWMENCYTEEQKWIKHLQEENKKQKEFYEKHQKENLDAIVMLTEQVKKLKEEIEELKEDNKELKEEKMELEEQIDELGDYCKNLSDEPYTQDAYEVFEKITQ